MGYYLLQLSITDFPNCLITFTRPECNTIYLYNCFVLGVVRESF